MAGIKKIALCLAIVAAISIISTPVNAGLLDTGTVYNGWKGTTDFAYTAIDELGTHDLRGYVEWAVFGPKAFPFTGYTPAAGELSYVYQIFNTGADAISQFSFKLDNNKADSHGTFSDDVNGVTGDIPQGSSGLVAPGSTWWDFDGIPQGGSSQGLVFSSSNVPQGFAGIMMNHGGIADVDPIPRPSSNAIPEPTTLATLFSALGFLATVFGIRRFSRS